MVESSSGRLRAPGGSHVSVPDGPISTSSAQSLEPRVTHEVTHEPKPPAPLPLAAYSQPTRSCWFRHLQSCSSLPSLDLQLLIPAMPVLSCLDWVKRQGQMGRKCNISFSYGPKYTLKII